MTLIIVTGERGSGKTLYVTRKMLKSKRPIFSTFNIKTPNYEPLTLLKLLNLGKLQCELALDEGYTLIESRTSMKYQNQFMSYLAFQLRKSNRNIFITATDEMSIDVRYRRSWDFWVECRRIPNEYINYKKWDFQFTVNNKILNQVNQYMMPYERGKRYFPYYNTYEIVEPTSKSKIEFEILKSEPEQFFNKATKIYHQIKSDLPINKKITHDYLSVKLMKYNIDPSWEKIIYMIVNNHLIV